MTRASGSSGSAASGWRPRSTWKARSIASRCAWPMAHRRRPRSISVDRLLETYGSTGAYGRAEQPSHKAITQEIAEQRVFGLVLPSVFLGVAVFLLNVVLTRQIGTQRGQIAVLKALGYANARDRPALPAVRAGHRAAGDRPRTGDGGLAGSTADRALRRVLPLSVTGFAMPTWIVLGGNAGRAGRRRRGRVAGVAARRAAGARRGDAAADAADIPRHARRATGLRPPVFAGGAHDPARHGAPAGARTGDHAGHRRRGGDPDLRNLVARRDRLPVRSRVPHARAPGRRLVLAEPRRPARVRLARLPGVMRAEIDRAAPVRCRTAIAATARR